MELMQQTDYLAKTIKRRSKMIIYWNHERQEWVELKGGK